MRDEEQIVALALSDTLASTLMRAIKEEQRTWLYDYEREGLQWLLRFWDRRPEGEVNGWIASFLRINRDPILSLGGRVSFNLGGSEDV